VRTIRIQTGQPYPALIGRGLLADAGRRIASLVRPSQIIAVTSRCVDRLHGRTLRKSLGAATWIHVPDGEVAKSPATLVRVLEVMARAGADRNTCVIAFGGGSVGDLAGMAASLYMRGVAVVQVPTTLLAQVDSAVGGKTAINLAGVKNLVGTFHQPRMVLADPDVLRTLPEREFRSGIYEAIKCGAISDRALFAYCENSAEKILAREAQALETIIAGSIRIKAKIVAQDEREKGLRRVLNFGHTIGHALEAVAGPRRLLHGEAVALGMIAAAEIGVNLGATPEAVAERFIACILRFGILPKLKVNVAALQSRIALDKKADKRGARFVLLDAIGSTVIRDNIPAAAVRDAIRSVTA
jgi:3-dehydroquinate synthase